MPPIKDIVHDKRIPWYLCCLYLFFNSVLLPGGLYFTSLLAPVLFVFTPKNKTYAYALMIGLFFLLLQVNTIADPAFYARSLVLTWLHIPFLILTAQYVRYATEERLDTLAKNACYLNFVLLVVALAALYIPVLRPVFWYEISITEGSAVIPRLKLFQTEASVYSLIMAPIFLYVIFRAALQKDGVPLTLSAFVGLPLLLSLSFGVCGALLFSLLLSFLFFGKTLRSKELFSKLMPLWILLAVMIGLWCWWQPDNLLLLRLKNIINGKDTSANGRTFESFQLAINTLRQHNAVWWGIGPGQFKVLGKEMLLSYYKYYGNVTDIRIPNACADLLVTYGVIGLAAKIGLEVYLFVKTSVFRNYYRSCLFVFLFVYQFTGSYFNNPIEWWAWVLVFAGSFPLFSKQRS